MFFIGSWEEVEEVVGRGGRGRWATVRAPRRRAAGASLGKTSWEAAEEPLPVAPTLPLTREVGPGVESEARPQRPGPASALPQSRNGEGPPAEPRSRGQGGWGPEGRLTRGFGVRLEELPGGAACWSQRGESGSPPAGPAACRAPVRRARPCRGGGHGRRGGEAQQGFSPNVSFAYLNKCRLNK